MGTLSGRIQDALFVTVLFSFTFYLLPINSFAQTTYQQGFRFPHTAPDFLSQEIQQTADSGFVMVFSGGSEPPGYPPRSSITLVKTDKLRNITANQTFRSLLETTIHCEDVQQTIDSGYIMVGWLKESGYLDKIDGFVLKTDKMGTLEWSKRIGRSTFQDNLNSVQQTKDGGYIMLGLTASFGSGGWSPNEYLHESGKGYEAWDIWLIKFDAVGTVLWTKTYGNTNTNETGIQVKQTTNSGFVIIANLRDSIGTIGGGDKGLLLKTDSLGTLQWSKTYVIPRYDGLFQSGYFNSIQQTTDKGFIVAGFNDFGWLLKLDSLGTNQWNKQYYLNKKYGVNYQSAISNVYQEKDKGYVFTTGPSMSSTEGNDLIKADTSGNIVWRKQYDTQSMVPVAEGGYASVSGNLAMQLDVLLTKTDTNGNVGTCQNTICNTELSTPVITVAPVTLSVGTGISISALGLTQLVLSLSDTVGCFADTSVTANFFATSICFGDSSDFTDASSGATLLNWNFGDPVSGTADISKLAVPPKHLYPATGTYTVTLIATRLYDCNAVNGSTDTFVKTITIFDKFTTMNAGLDVTICSGASATLNATGWTNFYSWTPFDGTVDTTYAAKAKASPTITTTYYATGDNGKDNGNCLGKDSLIVTVLPKGNASIKGVDTICRGNSTVLSASGGAPYLWNTGARDSSIKVSPLVDSLYWVIASAGFCSDTAEIKVKTLPLPLPNTGGDVTVNYGSGIALFVTGTGSYLWYPPEGLSCTDCPSPMANPEGSTIYYVRLTDTFGCTARDSVKIFVDLPCGEVFVPNAFSPNDDGYNDVLYVRVRCAREMEFKIFDRWGNKVFESTKETEGWDGTYKGKAMDPAVFVYYLEATLTDGNVLSKKGHISLIR